MSHAPAPRGTFVLSLDLPATAQRSSLDLATHSAAAQLIRQVRAHHVAATWTIPAGTNIAQLADLLGQASGHHNAASELAWRAEPSWAGPSVGRGKFAVGLAERASAALDADVGVATLVLTAGCASVHLDVAAKYGVRALIQSAAKRMQSTEPYALRFGIWNVPIAATIAAAGHWWTNQARRAIQEINRAARTGTTCHIYADLARPEAVAVLDRVLAHVQRCRVEGRLAVETVGQLAARLARPRAAVRPAHSILRAA